MKGHGAAVVAGVVLAAGRSVRYDGHLKQLIDWDGEPLLVRTIRTALASRLDQVVVVLGHAADEISPLLAGLGVEEVRNPAYATGLASSVRAGLSAVQASAQAALFLPADQPFLTSGLLDRLICAYAASKHRIVLPAAGGHPGSPVLWDRSLFGELAGLAGDTGGRSLLKRFGSQILAVEVQDPLELADLDSEQDHRRLLAELAGRGCKG